MANRTRQRGFTMAEVILAVGVLAILVTMASPTIVTFLRQKDIRDEQLAQLNIQSALQAMLKEKYKAPDQADATPWYTQLSRYTSLSPAELQNDKWRNPRTYVSKVVAADFQGTPISVTYVTVLSKGPNGKAEQITDASSNVVVPISGNDFAAISNTNWWNGSAQADIPNAFAAVGVPASGTNIITRYTNYADRVNAAVTTQNRMVKVAQAIEAYSRARYAERVIFCNNNPTSVDCNTTNPPDLRIHIPEGGDAVAWAANGTPDSAAIYNPNVIAATVAQNGGDAAIYNGNSLGDAFRLPYMITVMRMIGLPDEYCCSAVNFYTDASGNLKPMPLFYFSNPRKRTSATACGGRFDGTTNTILLPPRVTNVLIPDGTSGATCG